MSKGLPVSYILIAINVIVSLIGFSRAEFFNAFLFQVGPVRDGEIYRLLTSGFLHGNFTHLLFNMFTLFFFGPVLEDCRVFGKKNFLIVYFFALLAGNLGALWFNFNNPYYAAVGASGAISGIMVSVSLFVPFMTILIFGIIPIPAILFTGLFIAFSFFAMRFDHFSNVGHEAHLVGAVAGLLVTIVIQPRVIPNVFGQIAGLFSNRKR